MTKARMRKIIEKLEWNVLIHDFNSNKFVNYNIMREDLADDLFRLFKGNPNATFEEVKKVIRSWAMYHYWSKVEFEVVVSDMFERDEEKIDAFRQIEMNLDVLTQYIMSALQK